MQAFFSQILQLVITIITDFLWMIVIIAAFFSFLKIVKIIFYRSFVEKNIHKSGRAYLLIKIPSTSESKEAAMEEFLKSLHRTLPDNALFSLEMVSSNQFLRFYIVIEESQRNTLESQLYAQYPEAEIEESPQDYLPSLDRAAIVQLDFKHKSIYPIISYKNLQEDLLKNLSAILSKTSANEQICVQLSLKKVGSKFWQRGLFFELFQKPKEESTRKKLAQDLFLGKLRIAYIAADKITAKQKLASLSGLFKLLKGPNNELVKRQFLLPRDLAKEFEARVFEDGNLWSGEELSAAYHFPYKGNVLSNVVNTTSKRAPAPDILPREGSVDSKEVSFFGETNYRNQKWRFGIKRLDRRRHMYVVGKTGSGKSRLIELLLISDILSSQGCCLLDPHGDLAEEILKFVPKNRIKDVVYINPADREFPIGFNPLEPVEDYETRQHLATFFISIFKKLFDASWNSRMEHLIRYITLALLETPDSSILGIPRMLSDTSFRQRVIMQIKDPIVKGFWTNEFSASAEQFSREAVIPILNKVGQFISNPIVRNMVGQKKNMLDFSRFMNQGKIVIINISKGKLGDDNAALLGSMFITKIQQAALSRAKVPEEERRDFYFYVDEFQNFATEAFSSILSEARKYHLNLTIAHQYIAQLPDEVKATAFGNVGSLIVFPVGGDDAAYLAKEFTPTFTADDMINLNLREMYIKMSVDGKLTPPFSAKTINVPKSQTDYSNEILSYSRLTYGKSKVSVENEIRRWSESSKAITSGKSGDFPEPII
ncbi:MAG: type IV secretion system DNA-binding domain-containing protein [bacterium]|nr:type IV secretion system DNA-binding domain-containing protein [bacterium]